MIHKKKNSTALSVQVGLWETILVPSFVSECCKKELMEYEGRYSTYLGNMMMVALSASTTKYSKSIAHFKLFGAFERLQLKNLVLAKSLHMSS